MRTVLKPVTLHKMHSSFFLNSLIEQKFVEPKTCILKKFATFV